MARTAFANFQKNKSILESRYGNFEDFKNRHSWLKTYTCFQSLKILKIMNHGGHGIMNINVRWISIRFKLITMSYISLLLQYLFLDNGLSSRVMQTSENFSSGRFADLAAPDSSEVWANQSFFKLILKIRF